ncbi:MAG: STAS domain-containing protein [Thermodesulfobacteriota bacterium]
MRILIEGDCTVGRADELRAALMESMASGGRLELDFSGITSMDLTFCQLIHSLRKTCAERNVELVLEGNLPESQSGLAMLCGLPDIAGRPGQGGAVSPEECR